MKEFIRILVHDLFGVSGHRFGSFMRALQTGIVALAFGDVFRIGFTAAGLSMEGAVLLAALGVFVLMGAVYHLMTPDKDVGRAMLFGLGSASTFFYGRLLNVEASGEGDSVLKWTLFFIFGAWCIFRAFAEGKTGTTCETKKKTS